jgi:uroporphyrin-III C-methyltransferase/precorrin-2 dehydrogenase/sirohydrochlorin ferrochelatase/uroporphyrin-III C-methyltransferase
MSVNQTEKINSANDISLKGRVVFAGAGPGDPDLITIKAVRCLQQAEVVITDRLVSDQILEAYVSKDAVLLHAGKQAGRDASCPQSLISELIVEYARQGKLVVRLKGGDVSIFSNILDELQAVTSEGIPFEIIPGITAAAGAAACAGIPLTARGYASGVRLLSLHDCDNHKEEYWQELAQTEDTLVFYMGSGCPLALSNSLVKAGIPKDRLMAVIEQATTPQQQVYCFNIHQYSRQATVEKFRSPALIIVGKTPGLHEQFRWMQTGDKSQDYFRELTGKLNEEARA